MEIADIHRLAIKLDEAKWTGTYEGQKEDDQEEDEFCSSLHDMYVRAAEDMDALLVFFEFATNVKGSSGAYYEWDSEEFKTAFEESFRGSDRTSSELVKNYYREYGDNRLSPLFGDRYAPDYFDWTGYIKKQRPDLHALERNGMFYLFESE